MLYLVINFITANTLKLGKVIVDNIPTNYIIFSEGC